MLLTKKSCKRLKSTERIGNKLERNLDVQYQRQVAQSLCTYLAAVRREQRTNQEEKIRQEKARSEAATRAIEEAEREKEAKRVAQREVAEEKNEKERVSVAATTNVQAAESALRLEKHRLKKLQELEAINQSRSNQDFSSFENRIHRVIKQITKYNASARADEIV